MERVLGQIFESEVVTIDGRAFLGCQLIRCELRYSGGVFQMTDTLVTDCQWAFGGAARRTMEVLSKFDVLAEATPEPEPRGYSAVSPYLLN